MGGSAKKMFGGGSLGAIMGAAAGFLIGGPAGAYAGAALGGAQGASTGKQTYDAEKLAKQEAQSQERIAKINASQMVGPSQENNVMYASATDKRNSLRKTILSNKSKRETFGGNNETFA